jgi:hypothetical protein
MDIDTGRSPDGSGSRPSDEAAISVASSPEASIPNALLELAERCERAAGPDKRLDTLIEIACNPDRQWIIGEKPGRFPRDPIYGPLSALWGWAIDEEKSPPEIGAPTYTASLDVARSLVGDRRTIINIAEDDITTAIVGGTQGCADTPALALCAASLRVRAAQAIEAQSAKTEGLGPKDESAVPEGNAP